MSAVAASLYLLFFKFAKDDIKQMGEDEASRNDRQGEFLLLLLLEGCYYCCMIVGIVARLLLFLTFVFYCCIALLLLLEDVCCFCFKNFLVIVAGDSSLLFQEI